MGKYNFAAKSENVEALRDKAIKHATIGAIITLLVPWVVWLVPSLHIAFKIISIVISWVVVPCFFVSGYNNADKFPYQTRFGALFGLPISVVAFFFVSQELPEYFFPLDTPCAIFATLLLVLIVVSLVNFVYYSFLAYNDKKLSPKDSVVDFTTRIIELYTTHSKNSTSYWAAYIDHLMHRESKRISRSEYAMWKVGEVLKLKVRRFVLNPEGAYVTGSTYLGNYSGPVDSDELLFEKSQSGEFVSDRLSNATSIVSKSFTLLIILAVSLIVAGFIQSDECLLRYHSHPAYLLVLCNSLLLALLVAFYERVKLLKLCECNSAPYKVWCDKLIRKLTLATTTFFLLSCIGIYAYNKYICSDIDSVEEIYPCTTFSKYHSTKHGHYYTYHAKFLRAGENRPRVLEIYSTDYNTIHISVKKGLFDVIYISDYFLTNE